MEFESRQRPRHSIPIGFGANAASNLTGIENSFSVINKWPGKEADHSAISCAELKNVCGATPPLQHKLLCLVYPIKYRTNHIVHITCIKLFKTHDFIAMKFAQLLCIRKNSVTFHRQPVLVNTDFCHYKLRKSGYQCTFFEPSLV